MATCEDRIASLNSKLQALTTKQLNKEIKSNENVELLQLSYLIKDAEDRLSKQKIFEIFDAKITCKAQVDLYQYHHLVTSYFQRLKVGIRDEDVDAHRQELKYLKVLKAAEAEKRFYQIFTRVQNMESQRQNIKTRWQRNVFQVGSEYKPRRSKMGFQMSHKEMMENNYNIFAYSFIVFVKLTLMKQYQRLQYLINKLGNSITEKEQILTISIRIKYLQEQHRKLLLQIQQLSSENFSLLKTFLVIDCFNPSFLQILFKILKASINRPQTEQQEESTVCQRENIWQNNNQGCLHQFFVEIFLHKFFKYIQYGQGRHEFDEKYDVQGIQLNLSQVEEQPSVHEFKENCLRIISKFPQSVRAQMTHDINFRALNADFSQAVPQNSAHILDKQEAQQTSLSLTQNQKDIFINENMSTVQPFFLLSILQNSTFILLKFGSQSHHIRPVAYPTLLSAKGFFTTLSFPYRKKDLPYSDIRIVIVNVIEYKLKKNVDQNYKVSDIMKMQTYSRTFERIIKQIRYKKRYFDLRAGLWNIYDEQSVAHKILQKISEPYDITKAILWSDMELNILLQFLKHYIRKIVNISQKSPVHPKQVLISMQAISICYLAFRNYIETNNEYHIEDILFMRKYLVKAQKFILFFRGLGISRKICNKTQSAIMNFNLLSRMAPQAGLQIITNIFYKEQEMLETEELQTFRQDNYWLTFNREAKRAIHKLVQSTNILVMKDFMNLINIHLILCSICEQNVRMLKEEQEIHHFFRTDLLILPAIIKFSQLISSIYRRKSQVNKHILIKLYFLLYGYLKTIELNQNAVIQIGLQKNILRDMAQPYPQEFQKYFQPLENFSQYVFINELNKTIEYLIQNKEKYKIITCPKRCKICQKYDLQNGCSVALVQLCLYMDNNLSNHFANYTDTSNPLWMKGVLQQYSNVMKHLYPAR